MQRRFVISFMMFLLFWGGLTGYVLTIACMPCTNDCPAASCTMEDIPCVIQRAQDGMRLYDLRLLHWTVRGQFIQVYNHCRNEGIPICSEETYRTSGRQYLLLNAQTTKATSGESYHNYGLAVDFVPRVDCRTRWDCTHCPEYFDQMATIAESFGLVSGHRWSTFQDSAHLEASSHISVDSMQTGWLFSNAPLVNLQKERVNDPVVLQFNTWSAFLLHAYSPNAEYYNHVRAFLLDKYGYVMPQPFKIWLEKQSKWINFQQRYASRF